MSAVNYMAPRSSQGKRTQTARTMPVARARATTARMTARREMSRTAPACNGASGAGRARAPAGTRSGHPWNRMGYRKKPTEGGSCITWSCHGGNYKTPCPSSSPHGQLQNDPLWHPFFPAAKSLVITAPHGRGR